MFNAKPTMKAPVVVCIALFILLCGNLAVTHRLVRRLLTKGNYIAKTDWSYIGSDYPTWYEIDVPAVEMTFDETMHYPMEGAVAEVEWRSTIPQTHYGYVRIGPDKRIFALAMFHELHCVNTFREALLAPDAREENLHHVQHCLNYIRQLFLCSADATLEPGDFTKREYYEEAPGQGGVVGQWGVTRECRDWSAVIDAAAKNYVDWREFLVANRSQKAHH